MARAGGGANGSAPKNRSSGRTLRILFAIDKFKGCLTSREVAEAFSAGLRDGGLAFEPTILPVADGGDGLLAAFQSIDDGYQSLSRLVTGPLGTPVQAQFLRHRQRPEWVIEMAQASGLALLKPEDRNPENTSTRGTGELIAHALQSGAKKIVVGLGGSATNDGGVGAAAATGYRFIDALDCPIEPRGGTLSAIAAIDPSKAQAELRPAPASGPGARILVACDVDNPLTGSRGASHVYGPQKGADPAMVERLDAGLAHLAQLMKRDLGVDVADLPGAGAAGGLGAGLVAFCGATLKPGAELILDAVQFDTRAQFADVVVTGEGRLDGQTSMGKAPWAVAQRAQKLGKPVVAVAGRIESEFANARAEAGGPFAAAWAIRPLAQSDEDSMRKAATYLRQLGAQVAGEFSAFAKR
ncbi:MAG TPA: glycerate kinase [Planctomycetota bacterium]|nr:glycerate kinase [Planctomycetota bacterium]